MTMEEIAKISCADSLGYLTTEAAGYRLRSSHGTFLSGLF